MEYLVANGSFLEDINGSGESPSTTADFSRSRRSSAVLLNRRNNAIGPEGLYRCDVIDARNINQTVYIKVNYILQGFEGSKCLYYDLIIISDPIGSEIIMRS